MANLVEIVINGKDNTNAAFNRVLGNTQKLSKEMKSFGTVINNVGSAASTLGNSSFSNLANKTAGLIMAGEALALTFRKVNLTMKSTVIGLAAAAAALGVAKYIEYKDAVAAAAEATEKLFDIQRNASIDAMFDEEGQQIERAKVGHLERLKQIEELEKAKADQAAVEAALNVEDIRSANEITKIKAAFKQKELDDDKRKTAAQLALHEKYATGTAEIFGNLASVAAAFGKKGFAAFKAFRIAEAIASTYAGAARALADYPWPYSIAVAASVVAAGIANVASIAAAKPAGQAHAGMDYIPQEGSYTLQRGEMVPDPGTSQNLRDMAENYARGGGMGPVQLVIEGRVFGQIIEDLANSGRLTINSRAIVK